MTEFVPHVLSDVELSDKDASLVLGVDLFEGGGGGY